MRCAIPKTVELATSKDVDLHHVHSQTRKTTAEHEHVGTKMASNGKRSKKGKRKGKQKAEPVPVPELEEPKDMEEEIASKSYLG